MSNPVMQEQALIEKIRALPSERVAEVEDFVDFLSRRDSERPPGESRGQTLGKRISAGVGQPRRCRL